MLEQDKALEIVRKADWKTLLQMHGYLTNEEDLRALVYNMVDMIAYRAEKKTDGEAAKQLQDFLGMFDDERLGARG